MAAAVHHNPLPLSFSGSASLPFQLQHRDKRRKKNSLGSGFQRAKA
jgi:hypothetical protein